MKSLRLIILFSLTVGLHAVVEVDDTGSLVAAVRDGTRGETIQPAPGTYELSAPLLLKTGMTLAGAGMDKTIITHTRSWKPSTEALPTPETTLKGFNKDAYLIRLDDKAKRITISGLTLRGPQMHGAIFTIWMKDSEISHNRFSRTKEGRAHGPASRGARPSERGSITTPST